MFIFCQSSSEISSDISIIESNHNSHVILGIERTEKYIPLLKDKRVGLIVNHSSQFFDQENNGNIHIVDSLLNQGINIVKIYAPEHGFRGTADAGEKLKDGKDLKTGIPIISLYGKNRRPTPEMLSGIDVLLFDIQDVGVRFYTYISTLEYSMEAAATHDIEFIVLDRPNPNGHIIDGPILDKTYQSFIGRQEIPILHGLTVGEYAQMLKGEGWIKSSENLQLTVIPCENYNHAMKYELPIAPSPNLPNQKSILLYPSLCLFEGTVVSIGRGTEKPFQVIGHPNYSKKEFSFQPKSRPGAKNPKLNGEKCYGIDLSQLPIEDLYKMDSLNLQYFMDFYTDLRASISHDDIFLKNNFIDKLMGSAEFRLAVQNGASIEEIKSGWKEDLERYKSLRKGYLLYPDK